VLLTAPDSASSKAFKEIAAALDERAQRIYQERTKAEGKRRILPIVQS
jgi:hypothetical protein